MVVSRRALAMPAAETPGPPAAARAEDAPAPPLGQTQRRGSIELSGSIRDWATTTRPRFLNSQVMVRCFGVDRPIGHGLTPPPLSQRAILEYRKGRTTRRDLEAAVERNRAELFQDYPDDGNLLHDLTRRGFTRALVQVILPGHPDVRT